MSAMENISRKRGRGRIVRWPSLARLMDAKGLTDEGLAMQIGLTKYAIGQWRRGERRPDSSGLCMLAEHLRVPVAELAADMPRKKFENRYSN